MRFIYSIVRFVPNPLTGEFINVAAIAGSEESSEWAVRIVENPIRARAIDPLGTLDAVWSFVDRIGARIDEHEKATVSQSLFEEYSPLTEQWLHELHVEHRNLVQLSVPAPLSAESADQALDRVFDLMVIDPAQRQHRFQKKHTALAAVRAAYRRHHLEPGVTFRERPILRTDNHRERLDFAVTNGEVLQFTQTWSFQIPDQEQLAEQIKAWAWTMHDVRRGGGVAAVGDDELKVNPGVDLDVVFVPPEEPELAPALGEALAIFDELDVAAVAVVDADAVGRKAHDLLTKSGVVLDLRA